MQIRERASRSAAVLADVSLTVIPQAVFSSELWPEAQHYLNRMLDPI
jgi:hypothetical protein